MSQDVFGVEITTSIGPEQLIGLWESKLQRLQRMLELMPDHTNPLNGAAVSEWKNLTMVTLGRVVERVQVYQELKLVPVEKCEQMRQRALSIMNQALAKLAMG